MAYVIIFLRLGGMALACFFNHPFKWFKKNHASVDRLFSFLTYRGKQGLL